MLIIATGSNLGNKKQNLDWAKNELCSFLKLVAESKIYSSEAVDYENQPDFYNQVLQFSLPSIKPDELINRTLEIEKKAGRERLISKGPRTIDIDILFWGLERISLPNLIIPHPHWNQRSFVVRPLSELPFFHAIEKCFTIPTSFKIDAFPIKEV